MEKSTDSHDGAISDAICQKIGISFPSQESIEGNKEDEETELLTEVNELRQLVVTLEDKVNYITEALLEVVNYVREQSEEKQAPVGCGFSCTNNSVTLG